MELTIVKIILLTVLFFIVLLNIFWIIFGLCYNEAFYLLPSDLEINTKMDKRKCWIISILLFLVIPLPYLCRLIYMSITI